MTRIALIGGAAAAVLMLGAQPALAQTVGEATSLGEIVVTAQKREEKLQEVPAAVSVISGDALAARGSVNLEGAQYLVPTLNFRKSGTTINQTLFLRGVGTSTFSIAGEPSISTVVDGVVFSRAGEAFSDLIDVERIEVLRGPQGTLFGKNTSAGVINIVTKRPGDTAGGYVEGGAFSNGGEYRVRAGVDVPFSDTVKGRFTAFYGTYGGNLRNVTLDKRVNGYEHWGVRGVIVANPSESLALTIIADYRESDDDCCAELIGTVPTNLTATVLPTPRGDRTRRVAQDLVTATTEKSGGVSLQADWSVGEQTVTYIGSYREYDNTEIRDGDWLPRAYVGFNQLHDVGPQTSNTLTQELRLTSPADQFFSYVVGAYYSRAETERTFTRNDIVCTLTPAPTVITPCGATGTVITRPTGTANFGSVFKNYALFGQGVANLNDRLRLIAGLRFTADKLSVFHSRVTTLAGPGIQPSFGPFADSTSNDNISGKAGVQYDLAPTSTAYATYSRGYKGPAYNVFYNLTATGTNVIDAETADSYEVGLKNTLLGGKLVLNLAAYYAKYHNFQANNPDTVAGVLVTRFTNAGTISTRGGELDFLFRPASDLNISGGLAYTDAKVDKFKVPTNGVVTGVVPSGTQLGYAPKWKGSLAIDYRIRDVGPVDVILGAQGSFQSKQIAQFDASAVIRDATTIDSYGLVDLSAGIADHDDRYRLMFQVKNLFDTSFASAITSGGPGGAYRYLIPREADRYYGLTARVNF
ncbi:MAG: TonB-dependent receptor [Alphaproteobacteria bacterium]|nr:TonB-dependent receptor [Alphaproteobacteria bacterium]MBU1516406.1 TonB-dependent receptor [Alphaproteobacteria bacterium]MBU2093357.1 TonB-dependent receptor [Alphaproteobacteria bacterium]MBU2153844.1 TonB-dependent receptor [Alphaproteobacteria bacterium]MBU2307716.1 TonB-dependent receptor [Alphaproteobacteria bacterium]